MGCWLSHAAKIDAQKTNLSVPRDLYLRNRFDTVEYIVVHSPPLFSGFRSRIWCWKAVLCRTTLNNPIAWIRLSAGEVESVLQQAQFKNGQAVSSTQIWCDTIQFLWCLKKRKRSISQSDQHCFQNAPWSQQVSSSVTDCWLFAHKLQEHLIPSEFLPGSLLHTAWLIN